MTDAATPSPKRRPSPEVSPPSSPASSSNSSCRSSSRCRTTVIALAVAVLSASCFQLGLVVGMDAGRRHCVEGGASSSSSSQLHADTGHLLDVGRARQQQGPCSCAGVPLKNDTETIATQHLRRSSAAPHAPLLDEKKGSGAYQASSPAETSAPKDVNDDDTPEPDRRQELPYLLHPEKVSNLIAGYEIVNRHDFASVVDTGVPLDPFDTKQDDVLILYTSKSSLPNSTNSSSDSKASAAQRAVENCITLKVVLTEQDVKSNCIAIVGHPEESYHVHRFHRIQLSNPRTGSREVIKVGRDVPLAAVPRIMETRGDLREEVVPGRHVTDRYLKELVGYLSHLPDALDRLRPIARKAAGGTERGPVVVMTVNKGQSELLLNFVCAAKARNLDLARVLVFATDRATAQLASGLGVSVFDVRGAFGNIPTKAAKAYGDDDFGRIVLAKIYCVHLLVLLGHDVLLQDVDVVWYRNPLEYFTPARFQQFDMIFQDDGNTSPRFAPYFANTGMYFVRSNARTVHLYSYLARMGDVLRELRCDQEMIAAYLAEHVSWTGLRVKVLGARTDDGLLFPGGYHFHSHDDYMRQLLRGEVAPYAFHMSWTSSKHDKVKLFSQMGEWRVRPSCVDNSTQGLVTVPASGIGPARTAAAVDACCSADALVKCHYRDKPSLVDCRSSPSTSDGGDDPFWPAPFHGTAAAAAVAATD
jgi:Nucleotide-diphospho-sugar transferase